MVKSKEEPISEKPMFDSSDIEGVKSQDFRSDEGVKIKKELDEMWQVIHQKGLEVGEPSRIIEDISRSITYLNKLSHIISEGKWKKKADELDEEVSKAANKGDYMWAYHKRTLQSQSYERGIMEIIHAVDIIAETLKKVQDRVINTR